MFNFYKAIPDKTKKIISIILLVLLSVLINQYYGYQGINPIDSFFSFNAGYEVANGNFPFRDYWTITGPFIDFTVALIFKIFGTSWFSYVLYASLFNSLFTIVTFYVLRKFGLSIFYAFLYSFFVSILAYPSAGTPYVDHQSAYMSIISIYLFILALKKNEKIYWMLLPISLGFSFLTKQAPTGHFILIILFLSIFHFIFYFNLKNIIYGFLGSLIFIFIFLLTILITKIPITSFFNQYIFFPISLGENRLEFLFPLEFQRIIMRFKLIHLSLFLLFFISAKEILKDLKYLKSNDFFIIISLIGSAFALIAHQLMTINGIFIFFTIPIFAGLSHAYCLKYFKKKNYIFYFLIILTIKSSSYYWGKYIHQRDFMDLRKVSFNKKIDAKILHKKLSGLQWITPLYPKNPKEEISKLQQAIKIIKKDQRKKTLVTDYQFISVIISSYDFSPNKYWYKHHAYPAINHEYFQTYRNFFINQLIKNKIQIVYIIKPLWGDDNVLETILNKNCVKKTSLTDILDSYLLKCKDIPNN